MQDLFWLFVVFHFGILQPLSEPGCPQPKRVVNPRPHTLMSKVGRGMKVPGGYCSLEVGRIPGRCGSSYDTGQVHILSTEGGPLDLKP